MFLDQSVRSGRRGAVAPLVAILLIPILAMIAFTLDLGYTIAVRTEIQNAADAAALAAAQMLMKPCVEYFTPGNQSQQSTILSDAVLNAKIAAQTVSSLNTAGGLKIQLADGDITVGYLDSTGSFSSSNSLPTGAFPNTVRITAKRDGTTNAQSPTFFAPIFGVKGLTVSAYAQASLYTVNLDGPTSAPPRGLMALPMTFDQNDWNAYVAGNPLPNNNTRTGFDGLQQIQIYPSVKDTGNFGLLSLDDSHTGSSTIRGWVNNGMQQSDVDALKTAGLIPLSQHNASVLPVGSNYGSWNWQGENGFKSTVVQDVNSTYVPGQAYLLPLFKPVVAYNPNLPNAYTPGAGQGSNYFYNIVQFVAVEITSDPTDNRNVYVRPAPIVLGDNAIATVGSPSLAGQPGSTPSQTVFVASKLTQ